MNVIRTCISLFKPNSVAPHCDCVATPVICHCRVCVCVAKRSCPRRVKKMKILTFALATVNLTWFRLKKTR